MAVTTSPVEIVINVVDGNSGEVISRVEKSLGNIGAAGASSGTKVAAAMKDIETAGGTAAEKVAKEFTAGESSLRTMNAEVRSLQGSIYGDSRAAAEFLAIWPKVGEAMELAFPAFGAIALIGVLGDAIEKGHELYEKYLDLDSAAKQYNEEIEKSRLQDFGNARSIETIRDRIEEATDNLKMYQQLSDRFAKQGSSGKGFALGLPLNFLAPGLGMMAPGVEAFENRRSATNNSDKVTQAQRQLDRLKNDGLANAQHQAILTAIEISHATDGELRGEQKITAELGKQRAINEENRKFHAYEEGKLNPADPEAFKAEREAKDKIAEGRAATARFALRREQAIELRHLREQALESGMRGEALYHEQMVAAIEDLKDKDMDSVQARNAIHEKFHNEQMRRMQEELNHTQMIQARAAEASMTGIQKLQAEGDIQIGEIRGNNDLSDPAKTARVAAAQATTRAAILAKQREFTQDVDQLTERSADHQIEGFARISADEKKQLDDLKTKFDETYGHMDKSAPGGAEIYAQGQARYERGRAAIQKNAGEQSADLARKNAAETAQIEARARARSLSVEQGKTAGIEAEYEERVRRYQEALNQQEISQRDFNRRVAAAAEERDAEMVEASKQAREKMARQFEGLFRGMNHPLEELQHLGEKAAGEAAAAMVQKYQQRHGGAASSTSELAGFGGLFGGIFGHGHPGAPGHAGAESLGHSQTKSAIFTVAAAQIHVGAASFAGPGGGMTSSVPRFLGDAGLPSSSGMTGISSAMADGIGFAPSSTGGFGGGGMSSQPSAASSALGDLQQGMGLFNSAKGIFGAHGTGLLSPADKDIPNGTLNADGSYTSSSAGGMLQGGGFGANAMGAAGGALGLYGAFEGNGGVGGAAGGAMSGMEFGMAVGGPIGAAVGAAAGAVMGFIGFGGREKARVYDLKQVRPRIRSDQLAYNTGSMDYMAAYSDLQALDEEAKKTTRAMGMTGKSYYVDSIRPEIRAAIEKFNNEERAGRSQYTASAAMFDVGSDFVPRTGMAVIHQGERIVPSDQNERITRAMEGGAMPVESSRGDVHLHVHAIDAQSSMRFLMANKHSIRSALNASYAENSGGSDA